MADHNSPALVIDQQLDARIEDEIRKIKAEDDAALAHGDVDNAPNEGESTEKRPTGEAATSAEGASPSVAASAKTPASASAPTTTPKRRLRAAPHGTHQEIAAAIVQFLTVQGVAPLSTRGEFWEFDFTAGVWRIVPAHTLKRLVTSYNLQPLGPKSLIRVTSAMVDSVIALVHTAVADPSAFDAPVVGFAFSNGFVVVDADAITLLSHSPAHRATSTNGVAYNPRARRRRWLRFLITVFRYDKDRKAKIWFIQEFIGACLLGIAPRYELVLVLLGGGSNGKSILMAVILALFPESTVAAVPPQQWGLDYKKAELANARLNAVSEVPERAILESADFKAIVTGELVSARQPYKPAFTFACQAGHIFLANRLPATSDQSHGFWRRFVIVKFNRRFVPGGDKKARDEAPAKGRDALIAELKEELPGIWAWALEGARRLLARGRFELPASHHEALAEWRRNADQVQDFIESCCKAATEPSTWARARTLYDAYRRWATGTGHRNILTERSFATRLAENVPKRQDNRGARYALILLHDAEWDGGGA